MSSDFDWVAEIEEEVPNRFQTIQELEAFVAQIQQRESGQLSVYKDYGEVRLPWWKRVLGFPSRDIVPCFSLEWVAEFARLLFHDELSSEYRVIDHKQPVNPSEELRRQMSFGEPTPAPIDECMEKNRAFAAIGEFIETGDRPHWLSYKYVR